MCDFFSVVSNGHGSILYFDAQQREQIVKKELKDKNGSSITNMDSHSSILAYNWILGIEEDKWNKWEYDPKTSVLRKDTLNNFDDGDKVLEKVKKLDFETILPAYKAVEKFREPPVCEINDKIKINPSLINCCYGYGTRMDSIQDTVQVVHLVEYDSFCNTYCYTVFDPLAQMSWVLSDQDFTVHV